MDDNVKDDFENITTTAPKPSVTVEAYKREKSSSSTKEED